MTGQSVRVGIVGDDEVVRVDFAVGAVMGVKVSRAPLKDFAPADMVSNCCVASPKMFDAIVPDVSQADGSESGDDRRVASSARFPVLVFSGYDNSKPIREALASRSSDTSRKSEEF